jgi:hypothetical protein
MHEFSVPVAYVVKAADNVTDDANQAVSLAEAIKKFASVSGEFAALYDDGRRPLTRVEQRAGGRTP